MDCFCEPEPDPPEAVPPPPVVGAELDVVWVGSVWLGAGMVCAGAGAVVDVAADPVVEGVGTEAGATTT